jgi:hypothetical protein
MNPGMLPARFQAPEPIPTIPAIPSLTPTITSEPSMTPFPTETPLPATPTPRPSSTPIPTATVFVLNPSATPTLQAPEDFPFIKRLTDPIPLPNVAYPDLGCNWLGIGGQVFDVTDAPVTQLLVQAGGELNGEPIDQTTITGSATQYGPGGYEFKLADAPIDSVGTVYVQLIDQNAQPLSAKVFIDTFNDCNRNLLLLNFDATE